MTLRIPKSQADALGLDLSRAVATYAAALKAHAKTVNKPAPSADPLIEDIVRHHSGEFEIYDDVPPFDRRQSLLGSVVREAHVRASAVLSPSRQQLAAIDQSLLSAKAGRTKADDARLAEIGAQFASIASIQRHAALLAVEIDELPDDQLSTWQPHGWPSL